MIKKANEIATMTELGAEGGVGVLELIKPSDYFDKPESLSFFALATLKPGASVGYHVHTGETEMYYILSGEGEYDDNGVIVPVKAGDVTFCKNGEGHGLVNTGKEDLVFNAMIIYE